MPTSPTRLSMIRDAALLASPRHPGGGDGRREVRRRPVLASGRVRSRGWSEGPDLAVHAYGWGRRLSLALGGRAVPVRERRRGDPGLERRLVAPAGDDKPGGRFVG